MPDRSTSVNLCGIMRFVTAPTKFLQLADDDECYAPLVAAPPIGLEAAERLAGQLKALADPARLRLLSLVSADESGEACVCALTEPIGLSQGTVSHHLKVLVEAGILEREQRGRWAYYRLIPGVLNRIGGTLTDQLS